MSVESHVKRDGTMDEIWWNGGFAEQMQHVSAAFACMRSLSLSKLTVVLLRCVLFISASLKNMFQKKPGFTQEIQRSVCCYSSQWYGYWKYWKNLREWCPMMPLQVASLLVKLARFPPCNFRSGYRPKLWWRTGEGVELEPFWTTRAATMTLWAISCHQI